MCLFRLEVSQELDKYCMLLEMVGVGERHQ